MEMISSSQTLTVPIWQILALLTAITMCTLFKKNVGAVVLAFLFSINWVFWQNTKFLKTEGQEYTMMAFFFGLGLICAFAIAWHMYKADNYD